jgi:hypothetical protein
MVGLSHGVPTVLVVVVLLLIVGICAADQARLMPHLESSEACCGFVQCSVLPIALLGFVLWATVAYLRPPTTPLIRSAVEDPLSPPPELIALRSA